jgi:hypothetical protein
MYLEKMKNKELNIFLLIAFSLVFLSAYSQKETKEQWIKLFNGKDLNNWIIKIKGHPVNDNYKNTFRVKEGKLCVNYDEYDNFDNAFGHIFYKRPFSNYRLKLQYRFIGDQLRGGAGWAKRNSGVMIHSQSPESMELNQDFPVSVEVQLLGGLSNGKERPTGNVCTPGTHIRINGKLITDHCISSSSKTYDGNQWVDLEILVINDSVIKHFINGKEVISYNKPIIGGDFNTFKEKEGQALKSGYISLQSESHPVEFKNIELLELKE